MNQLDLLRYVVDVLDALGTPYMIVGSFASGVYGEPRMTQDIDVVIDLKARDVGDFCRAFPLSDYYVSPEAAIKAATDGGQFNIIHPASGNKVDVMVPVMTGYNRQRMHRRRKLPMLKDREVYAAAPEDVILGKMDFYREGGSEKHLRDITGILKVSGEKLDRAYIVQWAEQMGLMEIWQAILRRLGEKS